MTTRLFGPSGRHGREARIFCLGLALTLFFLASSGCQKARMALDSDLAGRAEEMPVEGKKFFSFDESFRFGPYEAADVNRGWKRTTAWGFPGYEQARASQQYEFVLYRNDKPIWEAQCAAGMKQSVLKGFLNDDSAHLEWELSSLTTLACVFKRPGESKGWKMAMKRNTGEMVLQGVLTDGTTGIRIVGSQALADSSLPLTDPTGYRFLMDGQAVGAVEVINEGAVWLAPGQSEEGRSLLAAASASLLLYRELLK
ncbi:MAG: hypothetical protein KKB20_28930 [Proteobacteria bacterium]|nr:hypothetical protein [Pseudomonadota bacterium]